MEDRNEEMRREESGIKDFAKNAVRPGMTRRGFVRSAMLGMGAVAVGAAATACSPSSAPSGQAAPKEMQADLPETGPLKRVSPASAMAQTLLAAICPECLVSAPAEFSANETPAALGSASLPLTGAFTQAGSDQFAKAVSKATPDIVINVGFLGDEEISAFEKLGESVGAECAAINLNACDFSTACQEVAGLVGADLRPEVAQLFGEVDDALRNASAVAEDERFIVLAAGGPTGLRAFGSGTAIDCMVRLAGAQPFEVPGVSEGMGFIDERWVLDNEYPEIVFLVEEEAGADYASEGSKASFWQVSIPGRLGYLFPALVGRSVWVGNMSPFAKVTLGAAWMAGLLYPNTVTVDSNDLTQRFYSDLFGNQVVESRLADECDALFEAALPASRGEVVTESRELKEWLRADAEDMIKRLQEANDPANKSVEELREFYDAMCEWTGNEATDEDWREFMEALGRGDEA